MFLPRVMRPLPAVAWPTNPNVQRLAEVGVIVRDLPGRGLVRASVGWWTSDEDLDRLVAGL